MAPHDLAASEVAPAGQLVQLQLVVAAEGQVGGVLGVGVPASPAHLPSAAPRHLHIITVLISTMLVFLFAHLPDNLLRLLHVEEGEVPPAGQQPPPAIPGQTEGGGLQLLELAGEHIAAPPPPPATHLGSLTITITVSAKGCYNNILSTAALHRHS